MTAVCNATGLSPQTEGLGFPPATRFELADVCKPKSAGGALEKEGVTEVTSSVYRDGRDVPHHLALGTYVVIEGETDYARRCFKEYAMLPDKSGRYAALYRPIHMIGLELGISVASAALRGEPTGAPTGFRSDVAATAKRALKRARCWTARAASASGASRRPRTSRWPRLFPLGLAQNVRLKRDIAEGERLKWSDVEFDPERFRRARPPRDGGGVRQAQRGIALTLRSFPARGAARSEAERCTADAVQLFVPGSRVCSASPKTCCAAPGTRGPAAAKLCWNT